MSLLTDEEIESIDESVDEGFFNQQTAIDFARAIEAAVLAKLREQEPVASAYVGSFATILFEYGTRLRAGVSASGKPVPLYAHPMPLSDVIRDAERYRELIYAVQRKFPDESRHETALRYIKHAEAPSYSNASVKESK
jgi:hypothetical protein